MSLHPSLITDKLWFLLISEDLCDHDWDLYSTEIYHYNIIFPDDVNQGQKIWHW